MTPMQIKKKKTPKKNLNISAGSLLTIKMVEHLIVFV